MARLRPHLLCTLSDKIRVRTEWIGARLASCRLSPYKEAPRDINTVMATSTTFLASDGAGYERNMGRWSKRLATPFLAFTRLPDGERVLDVGCGTGHLCAAIAARASHSRVDGVDIAPMYVDYARLHNHHPMISYSVGDACALAFPDASFERVLSLLALHFVTQPDQAIAEMRRVAKPGACVAAAVWDARGGFVANRLFFDTAAALDPRASERRAKNYTRPLTRPGELLAAWKRGGLREVVETQLHIRMEFSSFDDYWTPYLGNDGPGAEYVRTLEEGSKQRLRKAVQAAYLDGEEDGPRSYVALAWAVKGVA